MTQINASYDADGLLCLPHRWQRTVDNFEDYFDECSEFVLVLSAARFIPYSLCTPQYRHKTMTQKACVCFASYQRLLYVYRN